MFRENMEGGKPARIEPRFVNRLKELDLFRTAMASQRELAILNKAALLKTAILI